MGKGKGGVMPMMMSNTMSDATSATSGGLREAFLSKDKTLAQRMNELDPKDEEDVEAVTGASGSIKKVYSKKDKKR